MPIALDALFSGNVDSVDIDYSFDLSDIKIDGESPAKKHDLSSSEYTVSGYKPESK